MANPNAVQSLNRLTQHLRGLLKTMAGEEAEPFHNNDSYDDFALSEGQLQELNTLLETAIAKNENYPGLEERQDWVVEREYEIARLEKENEDLRRMLGIDEASLSERGITVEADRLESGRYSTFLSSAHRRNTTGSNEFYSSRLGYWENSGSSGGSGSSGSGNGNGNGQPPTPALQRPMDLQPGMRFGPQARRTGIFGGGQQRGGYPGGSGRGVSLALGNSPSLWTNQTNSTQASERQGIFKEDTLWTQY